MGNVNFNTNVLKNVTIDKTVQLNVDKAVLSTVQLTGNLATAEASADAIGGGTQNGGGGFTKETFTVDGFDDTQIVNANALVGPNPASDGPLALAASDLAGVSRTLYAEVLSANTGAADLGINNPQASKLDFSASNNAFVNAYAYYDGAGTFDPFPGVDNDDIIADFAGATSLDDICFTYGFDDIDFDPGTGADGASATVRVSIIVGDSDGDIAISTVAFVPGADGAGFQDLDLTATVATLIDDSGAIAPGTQIATDANGAGIVVIGNNDDVDGDGNPAEPGNATGGVDFNDLLFFEILLEDDPTTATGVNGFASGDFFAVDSVIDENPSIDGTDASVDDFVWTRCVPDNEYGLLAEVDTFAQVDDTGAFAFSESLAAWDFIA